MAETTGWRRESEESVAGRLFDLACELDASEEGRRRRLEEKERMLVSAGVLLPGAEPADEQVSIQMMARICPSYRCRVGRKGDVTGR